MPDSPRRRNAARPLLAFLFLLLATATSAVAPAPSPLSLRLDEILDSGADRSAQWGVYVQDLRSGRVLYSRNADEPFTPASNMKLFTAATALDEFGSDHRYRTTLYFDGTVVNGSVLAGDLILRGAGDPTFGSEAVPGGGDPLREWALALARMGVERVEGRIVGDDDAVDDEPYAVGWDPAWIENISFSSSRSGKAASVGGLSYRDNMAEISISAGSSGRPRVRTEPEGYVSIHNVATTSRRGRLRLGREMGEDELTIRGTASRRFSGKALFPVNDPTAFALHSFAAQLREAGIRVDARLVDGDDVPGRLSYDDAEPLLVNLSPPMSTILSIMGKKSHNLYAEHVFRTFGWGTAVGAEGRVKEFLWKAGISTEGFVMHDGSGLSRRDRATPACIGRLLAHMYYHPHSSVFIASLAEGGEDKSTLKSRLRNVEVYAKTGTLRDARALSGYTISSDGTPLAFSIIANDFSSSTRVKQTMDRIVVALAGANL